MSEDLNYYLGLNYPIEILRSDDGVFAFHPDLDGCAAQGESVEEAISNLDVARQLWLSARLEDGLSVAEPVNEEECNGRATIRMSAALHAELLKISRRQRISLNQLVNNVLSEYVGGNRLQQQVLEIAKELRSALAATQSAVAKDASARRPVSRSRSRDAHAHPVQQRRT
jgi:predicted RNase H-like HicB family nuclease